jgi:hypothetical protein
MNTTSIVTVQPTDAFPRMQSLTQEHLTYRVNNEALCEMAFTVVTVGMATFLAYVCSHALQNYGVLSARTGAHTSSFGVASHRRTLPCLHRQDHLFR